MKNYLKYSGKGIEQIYLLPAHGIDNAFVSTARELEEKIFDSQWLLFGDTSILEGTYHWLGLEEGVEPIFKALPHWWPASRMVVEKADHERGIFRIHGTEGDYQLDLVKNGEVVRSILVYVQRTNILFLKEDISVGAVNASILMPRTAPWMKDLCSSVVFGQKFWLMYDTPNHYLYRRQLSMSWNVALIKYGDGDSIDSLSHTAKFAGDVLLLVEDDSMTEAYRPIEKIVGSYGDILTFDEKFNNILLKFGDTNASCVVAYDDLPASTQSVVDQLKAFQVHNKVNIRGMKVRQPKGEEVNLEGRVLTFLSLASSTVGRKVYLRFAFASNQFMTEDMAKKFTIDIVDNPCTVHCVTNGSPMHVYMSCSVYSVWLLDSLLDLDISKKYPSLLSIQEVCASDLAVTEEFEALKQDMQENNALNELDKRFNWQKQARIINDLPTNEIPTQYVQQ